MNNYFSRVIHNLKSSILKLLLLTLGLTTIAYFIGWNWEFIPKLMLLIIAFLTFQNSFLLNSNKNLYNAVAYSIFVLYFIYIFANGKFKADNFVFILMIVFLVYFVYVAIQSVRYYIQQKKVETEIFLNIRDDIQNTKSINIKLFSNVYGVNPEYLRTLVLSYLEDGLLPENITIIDE